MIRVRLFALLGFFMLPLSMRAQELYDPYVPLRLPFDKLRLIKQYGDTVEITENHLSSMKQRLQRLGLEVGGPPVADSLAGSTEPIMCLRRADASEWFSMYDRAALGDSTTELYNRWISGRYLGMVLDGHTIHLNDTPDKDAIRFALVTDRHVYLYQKDLARAAPRHDAPTPKLSIADYEETIRRANSVLTILVEKLIPAQYLAMGLMPDVRFTPTQRTYGLMKFWSEAKYNFAFFDQLPELDWEEKLIEYLPLVERDQSNREYYRLLERLAATLQDGHTDIYRLPSHIYNQYGRPKVSLQPLGREVIVTNVDADLIDSLPLGSIVLRIDDILVEEYLADSIYPYVAAGGMHTRRMLGVSKLLEGPKDSQVIVELDLPDGRSVTRTLLRQPFGGGHWVRTKKSVQPASFRMVEPGIGYLALNTFSDGSVVDTFMIHRPQISRCAGLIIDLRENGGGNSAYGYEILRHFTRQPLLTPAWSSPEHVPAYYAFGQWYSQQASVDTTERMVRESLNAWIGERYYHSDGDSIMPADTVHDIPVIVLVSTYTASAADNFLVVADPLEHFTFVGEPSFGSTGQPLFVDLPGGGLARICTKRNTYPDGRDYVGPGVQVDILVQPTAADFIAGRDVVLERALEELHHR